MGRDLLVDNAAAKKYICEVAQHEDYTIRLLPNEVTFPTDTIVFGDTIALFAYDIDRTIVRIENSNLADTFRSWFELLWKMGRKTGE